MPSNNIQGEQSVEQIRMPCGIRSLFSAENKVNVSRLFNVPITRLCFLNLNIVTLLTSINNLNNAWIALDGKTFAIVSPLFSFNSKSFLRLHFNALTLHDFIHNLSHR